MTSERTRGRPPVQSGSVKPSLVSIRTVAERAGVSIATVSNVLNSRTSVRPDLIRRVREAVDELGYVANGAAARLRSRRHSLAGLIVPDLQVPMFGAFVSAVEDLARQDGYDLIVASCRNDPAQEAERLRALRSWQPAGCIVIPVDGALRERQPRGPDLPLVAVDRMPDDPGFDCVVVDNAASTEALVRHLHERGYRRVLAVANELDVSPIQERWRGAQAGAGEGMELDLLLAGRNPARRVQAVAERLRRGPRPDAVLSLDLVTTVRVVQALAELGVAVGRDMGLASFDDSEWMTMVTPPITAVCQPVQALAEAAWTHLRRRIAGDDAPATVSRLPCRLTIRASTPPLSRRA